MNTTKRRLVLAGLVSLALVAAACGSDSTSRTSTTAAAPAARSGRRPPPASPPPPANLSATLNASGATFPKTFYEEAIAAFTEANTGVTINYGGGGSGKGRQDLADQIVDWAGTDGTIKDEDLPGSRAATSSTSRRSSPPSP